MFCAYNIHLRSDAASTGQSCHGHQSDGLHVTAKPNLQATALLTAFREWSSAPACEQGPSPEAPSCRTSTSPDQHDISWQQWRGVLLPRVTQLPLLTFKALLCFMCCSNGCMPSGSKPIAETSQRDYLERTVGALLRRGLAHVIEQTALYHVDLASGKLWDEDGHLPARFLPMRPARILGEWLQRQVAPAEPQECDPVSLDWEGEVPWQQLGVREQALIAFRHLDEAQTGFVDRSSALQLAADVGTPRQRVQSAVEQLEFDMNYQVTAEEFVEFILAVAADAGHLDQGLRPRVMAYFLARRPRQEQVRCATGKARNMAMVMTPTSRHPTHMRLGVCTPLTHAGCYISTWHALACDEQQNRMGTCCRLGLL
jgi:hypothetical protein